MCLSQQVCCSIWTCKAAAPGLTGKICVRDTMIPGLACLAGVVTMVIPQIWRFSSVSCWTGRCEWESVPETFPHPFWQDKAGPSWDTCRILYAKVEQQCQILESFESKKQCRKLQEPPRNIHGASTDRHNPRQFFRFQAVCESAACRLERRRPRLGLRGPVERRIGEGNW